jgi:hypothetical protein
MLHPAVMLLFELFSSGTRCGVSPTEQSGDAKKEAAIEHKALLDEIKVPMATFSLKQLSWSDRAEQTHRGDAFAPIIMSETAARL